MDETATTTSTVDIAQDVEDRLVNDMEVVLKDALRAFDVVTTVVGVDGPFTERVYAHYHDAASNPAGHLTFITITLDGRHAVTRMFNVVEWRNLSEIISKPTPVQRKAAIQKYAVMAIEAETKYTDKPSKKLTKNEIN